MSSSELANSLTAHNFATYNANVPFIHKILNSFMYLNNNNKTNVPPNSINALI